MNPLCMRTASVLVSFAAMLGCGDRRGGDPASMDLVGSAVPSPPEEPMTGISPAATPDPVPLHEQAFVVDLIQDLVFRLRREGWTLTTPEAHVNIEKLRLGGVDLVFSAIAPEPGRNPAESLEEQFLQAEKLARESGGGAVMVSSLDQARTERAAGRIPMMVLLEGADGLHGGIDGLTKYARRGLKIVGLTGPRGNPFGDSAVNPRESGGLTPAGVELVDACRQLGLLVDLTHASEQLFWDVLVDQESLATVSHAACRSLREHPRNLTDLQILALARGGGVLGLVFNPDLLVHGGGDAGMKEIVAHVERVRDLGAIGSLALGTDYGGINPPAVLPDIEALPVFINALKDAGLSHDDIKGILGNNALRLLEAAERKVLPSALEGHTPRRPLALDCESVSGEVSGSPSLACDHDLLGDGLRLPPTSNIRLRLRDRRRTPTRLEIFGEPGTPWQIEVQNLEGKVLVRRGVALDAEGVGSLPLPAGRDLTRVFLSPTRESALREAVIWGY